MEARGRLREQVRDRSRTVKPMPAILQEAHAADLSFLRRRAAPRIVGISSPRHRSIERRDTLGMYPVTRAARSSPDVKEFVQAHQGLAVVDEREPFGVRVAIHCVSFALRR